MIPSELLFCAILASLDAIGPLEMEMAEFSMWPTAENLLGGGTIVVMPCFAHTIGHYLFVSTCHKRNGRKYY